MIKQVTIDELPKLLHLASKFYSLSAFLDGFKPEIWIKSWTLFIRNGTGVIFALFDDNQEAHGALGALKAPDINGGFLIASEAFWFTEESHRGKGLYLLKAYEKWAKACGCKLVAMGYLTDSMPEKVRQIYEKCGYKQSEVTYVKAMV